MTISQNLYIYLINRPIVFLGAFFTKEHLGKSEKTLKALKFKTMTDVKDTKGNLLPDAGRLTLVGRFMRSTSIDELSQLMHGFVHNCLYDFYDRIL